MNYNYEITNHLKSYNQNEIIVSRELYQNKFKYIPEATFFKCLERNVKSGSLARVSKGIYCIPKISRFGTIKADENKFIEYFIGKNSKYGMITGYRLYNNLGLTTQISKTIELYSNIIKGATASVGNINIKYLPLAFTKEELESTELLEVLEHYFEIEDLNRDIFKKFIKQRACIYNEKVIKKIIQAGKYKKRTIASLKNLLDIYGIKNSLSEFLTNTSTYKTIPEEEMIWNCI